MSKPKTLVAPKADEFSGQVVAVVVGIEEYQTGEDGRPVLSKVDFARNDATGFVAALKAIYPPDQLDVRLFIDSQATHSSLDYALKQTIESLTEHDLFIFYYAGHGFHGDGGNRLTAWDSRPFNIEGSTLLLREKVADRLAASGCERALAFVDACATKFAPLIRARDVVTKMDENELKAFLSSATYNALFLSCKPGQQSYPSSEHAHGVWTYFLLKALRGEADEALGPGRYITASSLQDYLRKVVPQYVIRRLDVKGNQTPKAIIDQSNTFQIWCVLGSTVPMAEAAPILNVSIASFDQSDRKPTLYVAKHLERDEFISLHCGRDEWNHQERVHKDYVVSYKRYVGELWDWGDKHGWPAELNLIAENVGPATASNVLIKLKLDVGLSFFDPSVAEKLPSPPDLPAEVALPDPSRILADFIPQIFWLDRKARSDDAPKIDRRGVARYELAKLHHHDRRHLSGLFIVRTKRTVKIVGRKLVPVETEAFALGVTTICDEIENAQQRTLEVTEKVGPPRQYRTASQQDATAKAIAEALPELKAHDAKREAEKADLLKAQAEAERRAMEKAERESKRVRDE